MSGSEFLKWLIIFNVSFAGGGDPPIVTPVAMTQGGTGANIAPVNGSLVYSTASHMALVTPAANGVVITDGSSIPQVASTLPSAVQGNITTVGTLTTAVTISPVASQLRLGGAGATNSILITAPTPASSRTYTIPDAGANASFLMSEGAQTKNGALTLSNALTITATTNQIVLGTTNTTTITSVVPSASRVYTIPDAGGAASFVMSAGASEITGIKTFSAPQFSHAGVNAGGDFTFFNDNNSATVGSNSVMSISANGGDARIDLSTAGVGRFVFGVDQSDSNSFVFSRGTALGTNNFLRVNSSGNCAFANAMTISATSSQLAFGTTTTTTISATAPASSAVYTIPDVGTSANFIMSTGTQSLVGKTFTSTVTVSATTNQFILGTTNTVTLSATAPVASRTYTIPDAGTNADFVMSASAQTINGVKTFGSGILLPTSTGTPTSFSYYEALDTTLSFTGPFTGTQSPTAYFTRVGRLVTLTIAGFTVTGAGTSGPMVTAAGAVASRFRPAIDLQLPLATIRNGVSCPGFFKMSQAGTITVTTSLASGPFPCALPVMLDFPNSGNNGFFECSWSWMTPN